MSVTFGGPLRQAAANIHMVFHANQNMSSGNGNGNGKYSWHNAPHCAERERRNVQL